MKNSNELDALIEIIQARTNATLKDIAKEIGYAEAYLTRSKNDPKANVKSLVKKVRVKYEEVLKDRISDLDKIREFEAAFSVLIAEVASFRSERTGEPVQTIIRRLEESIKDEAKRL